MIKRSIIFWSKVFKDAVQLWLERNAFSYAGSLAFYTLFSLAPTVIIAVTVIGVVLGEDAAHGQIVAQLQDTMGMDAAMAIEQAVAQSRIKEAGILPTVLGIATILIGATAVFSQMQFSLNTIWGVTARPTANSALIFLKNRADNLLPFVGLVAAGSESLISLGVVILLFATIFKVLPDVILRWQDVLIGAVVTAILFTLGRSAIAIYLAHTATASTYGAAGSLVMILLWVYYSSLILLFGAAFTRSLMLRRGRTLVPRITAVVVQREFIDKETAIDRHSP